jgi:hypothetical protein
MISLQSKRHAAGHFLSIRANKLAEALRAYRENARAGGIARLLPAPPPESPVICDARRFNLDHT